MTRTTNIDERLAPYGRGECLVCGQLKERDYVQTVKSESVFAGHRYQLTCRNHPGHPLFSTRGRHEEAGSTHMEDIHTAPTRSTVAV